MGMLATLINGVALVDILENNGVAARLQTCLRADQVAEPFIRRRAIRHLEKGRVVVVAGGDGSPYVTTDTPAITTALELECDMVLKATKVKGVYDKDPAKHADAKKHDTHTFDQEPHRSSHERHATTPLSRSPWTITCPSWFSTSPLTATSAASSKSEAVGTKVS